MNDILVIGAGIGGLTLALELHARGIACRVFESARRPTSTVVLENRRNPPDAILREVYQRGGDKPFERIESVISGEELRALSERYKQLAGYDRKSLQEARS